jgi:phosphatidylglycerophosphatase C
VTAPTAPTASTVAVFDFDRTLSSRDNVLPFLAAVAGRAAVARVLLRSAPDVARRRRDTVKARLTRLLSGRDAGEIDDLAARFAADVVAHHLRDDVLTRAAWHVEQRHQCVIVSASYECYLTPIAAALGFDAALGTRLEVVDGRLSGRLDGENVRRTEKVRRLDEWLDGRTATVWAYGDSAGDRELLARADHPVRVRPIRAGRGRLGTPATDERVAR